MRHGERLCPHGGLVIQKPLQEIGKLRFDGLLAELVAFEPTTFDGRGVIGFSR